MQTNPERNDKWTTVSTALGTCTYNDEWIIYDIISAASVDIPTAWSSVTIDTLPVLPKFGARSTGVLKTGANSLEGGAEVNLDVSGAVRVTSYANPIQDFIVPIVRSYIMPR